MAVPFLDALEVTAPQEVATFSTSVGTVGLYVSTADPNGVLPANIGSLCMARDGTIWKKETDDGLNTGWVELTAGVAGGGSYTEVANLAARDALTPSNGDLVKVLSSFVTYRRYQNAWQIDAMHSTGSGADFDALNAPANHSELEIGQQFTNLTSNVTVLWNGSAFVEEGPIP